MHTKHDKFCVYVLLNDLVTDFAIHIYLQGLKFISFPYLLTLQLKRFAFDYATLHRVKLNDRLVLIGKNKFYQLKNNVLYLWFIAGYFHGHLHNFFLL